MGSLMTSSSSAGPIQIQNFQSPDGLIDDVIVIGWTDSDFKISRALIYIYIYIYIYIFFFLEKNEGKSARIGLSPYCKGSTLKGKNLLPLGANCFLSELALFRRGLCTGRKTVCHKSCLPCENGNKTTKCIFSAI